MKEFSPETMNVAEKISKAEKIVIYGAKKTAAAILPVCEQLAGGEKIQVAVTSLREQDALFLDDYKIYEIDDVTINNKTLVLVAMNESYFAQISQMPQLHDAEDVVYIDPLLAAEAKRYAAVCSLKRLGIDLRLFDSIYQSDIWGRTDVSAAFFPSIVEEMWRQATQTSARYVAAHMRNAAVFPHWEPYHAWLARSIRSNQTSCGINFEFGVASGVSMRKFAGKDTNIFYGFDSFEGLPSSWFSNGNGGLEKGAFQMDRLPQVPEQVELVKGWFDKSLPAFTERPEVQGKKADFIHIDCDLYTSAKTVFDYIHSFVRKGTIIAFDEYLNYPGWQEDEFKAFQEYVQKHDISYEYLAFVDRGTQVCVKILDFD